MTIPEMKYPLDTDMKYPDSPIIVSNPVPNGGNFQTTQGTSITNIPPQTTADALAKQKHKIRDTASALIAAIVVAGTASFFIKPSLGFQRVFGTFGIMLLSSFAIEKYYQKKLDQIRL